jgi:hypothetical protein
MKPARLLCLVGIHALLLAGCATAPQLQVEQKPGVDLAAYHSFAIMPMTEHVPGADPSAVKAAVPVITGVIRAQFLAKGYRETTPDQADFTVVLNAAFLPRTQAVSLGYIPATVGSGVYGSYEEFRLATDVRMNDYDQAVMALQVFDARTKDMVWVGFGTAMKKERASLGERVQRASQALVELLGSFPKATARAGG